VILTIARGSRAALRGRTAANLAIAALIATLLGLLMAPAFARPGNVFDEGLLLAYPTRVLEGDVPQRDFVSFYGPATPWLLAGVYKLAGATQDTERAVGLGYQIAIVVTLFFLCLPWGRAAGIAAAGIAALLLVPFQLEALASLGALALGLIGLALLAGARRRGGSAGGAFLTAGLVVGAGTLFRFDFAIALLLAPLPFLAGASPAARRRFLAGLLVALMVYLVHAAIVGPDKVGRVVSDLIASGPERRLPIQPFSSEPGRLLLLAVVAALTTLALALAERRRQDRNNLKASLLFGLALLSLGLLPYAVSRLDYVHVVPAGLPAMAALPACVLTLARPRSRRTASFVAVLAGLAVSALLLPLAPIRLEKPLRLHVSYLRGRAGGWSEPVEVDGRSFRVYAGEEARRVRTVVAAGERARRSGARSLFVGPRDLRTANKNDAFLYYLLADLDPASYYMEMNPRTANRAGSGLADELRKADVLILNETWDNTGEPSVSHRLGPARPNAVVQRCFDRVVKAGPYSVLYRRGADWRTPGSRERQPAGCRA
jgi:hypothetical protein